MTTDSELLPIQAVAERLKTTPLNVLMHIKRGLLEGQEVDGAWFVPAPALAAYLETEDEAAHGSLCKQHCQHGCKSSCS